MKEADKTEQVSGGIVAIYVRNSQNRHEDVDKPTRQREACLKWMTDNKLDTTKVEVYDDDNVSAFRGQASTAVQPDGG